MTARQIIDIYISFFEKRGHKRIPGAPLVPENDPTTLFTSSGMQPLIPYLLGEEHPAGKRLVNVQNSFRAVDIEEVGDDRHSTFFRMLGNWSLGDYFKKEQLPWVWELYTKEFGLDPKRLYVSIFSGYEDIEADNEAKIIWEELLESAGLNPKERIFNYGVDKNWWSRSGTPDKMPSGEPGGPDSEIFYDFGAQLKLHENSKFKNDKCHPNCDCGRYWEVGNNVFLQYIKTPDGSFKQLPKRNVDFGGGLERIIGATENQPDMFLTSLFNPTIQTIEKITQKTYRENKKHMQIIADHFTASIMMVAENVKPSNKEQGYILRRLLRRSLDHLWELKRDVDITPILETITSQYNDTDPILVEKFEEIKLTILEEEQIFRKALTSAKKFLDKEYSPSVIKNALEISKNEEIKVGDELKGIKIIPAEIAFKSLATYGLSPVQLESLGYVIDDKQRFAELIKQHQNLSRTASAGKFKGGLADQEENTIKGHSTTHLLHRAIRDMLGNNVHQTGSNITAERLRFDFNYDKKLTDQQIKKLEQTVNKKIKEDLPVRFEMLPLKKAKEIGAIGLFDEKYSDTVKVYFMGPAKSPSTSSSRSGRPYSVELCGGPHVSNTGVINSFRIIKQESLGKGQQRIYAKVS